MEQVRYTQADGTEFDAWVIEDKGGEAGSVLLISDGNGCRIVAGVSEKSIKKPETERKGKPKKSAEKEPENLEEPLG